MKKYVLLFLFLGLFFTSCDSDDNIVPDNPEQEEEEQEVVETAADYPVQNFMWQAMNLYYFWQSETPNLADDKFDSVEDAQYVDFLASKENPADFFYEDLCYQHFNAVGEASAIDRFSVTNDNYKDLVNSLQGISKSNGVEFNLYLFSNEEDGIYGVVNYIAPDSDASSKDIKRGDIFTRVDGQPLNLGNYIELLFGDNDTYTLGLAEITENTISDVDKEVELTKVANFSENPILVNKVIEQNSQKIGYLMYNGFLAAYDDELNEVFGEFKSQNISELILDFRYNPGGRVSSAIQISSAIYGINTEDVFLQPRYNSKLQEQFGTPDTFTDVTFDSETSLNTLELKRVYVITSGATASASELVINGLEPYIDVVQVGTTTTGKSEFSFTFVDDPEGGFGYNPEREQFINPDNQWAIQPLLGKNENADGFSGYENGLVPDYEIEEDIADLGVLGEESEPLLSFTLAIISGETAKRSFQPIFPTDYITNSKMFKPARDNMFMDGLLKPFKSSNKK